MMRNPVGLIVVIAAVLGCSGLAVADQLAEGYGGFTPGALILDVGPLNDALKARGIGELSDANLLLGGEGHGVLKGSILLGGEGLGFFQSSVESDSVKVSLSGGAGFFDVGYALLSRPTGMLYAMVGIGAGGISTDVKTQNGSVDFGDVLTDPRGHITVERWGFMLNFSVGARAFVKLSERSVDQTITTEGDVTKRERMEQFGGLMLGIRLGYMWMPYASDWKADQRDVRNGPDLDLSGPYLKVVLGGGGGERRTSE